MRAALIALMLTFATQAGADEKSYKPKDCEDISGAIDFLLSITPEKWDFSANDLVLYSQSLDSQGNFVACSEINRRFHSETHTRRRTSGYDVSWLEAHKTTDV